MLRKQVNTQQADVEIAAIEKLVQLDSANSHRGIQVTVKHVHEYQGSGLMEAFLALLIAVLFIFGSVFLTIAAVNFYQGVQGNRSIQRS
ncbi:hypothetical protein [Pantanalinema sp. GBBB05]|uniref:hypothetical protein n=1 Tax=Pantanalinema sp. GBBB05 TaxID=2604139 RepID=UPI001D44AF7B|nr:hypothetical protein [Pantanalinema sp. GBBB05]